MAILLVPYTHTHIRIIHTHTYNTHAPTLAGDTYAFIIRSWPEGSAGSVYSRRVSAQSIIAAADARHDIENSFVIPRVPYAPGVYGTYVLTENGTRIEKVFFLR